MTPRSGDPWDHGLKLPTLMETILTGLLALALFVYLLVAMIRPERF
ncbi:MAG TPA: K(+)-transporting ATPase subunit F [Luteolibacter sp.]